MSLACEGIRGFSDSRSFKDTDADLLDMIQDLGAKMEEQAQPHPQETAPPISDPVASATSVSTPMVTG